MNSDWEILVLSFPTDISLIRKSVGDIFRTRGVLWIFDGFFLNKRILLNELLVGICSHHCHEFVYLR